MPSEITFFCIGNGAKNSGHKLRLKKRIPVRVNRKKDVELVILVVCRAYPNINLLDGDEWVTGKIDLIFKPYSLSGCQDEKNLLAFVLKWDQGWKK